MVLYDVIVSIVVFLSVEVCLKQSEYKLWNEVHGEILETGKFLLNCSKRLRIP